MTDRRLIEDSLPLAEISECSAREKSQRHGKISTIHLWWARRPLAASRAAVLASLLPRPDSQAEREELHRRLLEVMNPGEISGQRGHALACRKLLLDYGVGERVVLDPFSGGGSIPLEALRVGCRALATDLNPVAHLIQLATLHYPQRFVDLPPRGRGEPTLVGESRLIAEVRHWSDVVGRRAGDRLRKYYGEDADSPLFFIWAREVRCANPACRARVPTVGSMVLRKSGDEITALVPEIDKVSRTVSFRVVECMPHQVASGFISRAKLTCPICGETSPAKYIKSEGHKGNFTHRLLAVFEETASGKTFRIPRPRDIELWANAKEELAGIEVDWFPDEEIAKNSQYSPGPLYGMNRFRDLYNPRQLLAMVVFSQEVERLLPEIEESNADLADERTEFARAVKLYLALSVSKLADYQTTICQLNPHGSPRVAHAFRMQALPMAWDYAESYPLDGAGSWPKIARNLTVAIEALSFPGESRVKRVSADRLPFSDGSVSAVVTDPPYYDAVPYSDLSDYFYVWLKRMLIRDFPDACATEVTPKRSEMIQSTSYAKDAAFFENAMAGAFAEMYRVLSSDGILVLVFAHKSTAAWETLLKALLDNNLVVTASWPIETEKPGRTRAIGSAALASSVFIVCRKRSAHEDGFIDDVEPALKERLHERLDYFWSQGIRGADFFMSAIGPAVEVFGRHKRVLKLSGDEVTIAELLDKVRGIVADYALQRIVQGAAAGAVDEPSRFYVIWRWAYGTSEIESGEAIHMAQSMGVEFNELVADKGVLNKKGNKVSLKGPLDRKKVKGLGEPSATGTLAPLIDVLHGAANLWAAGERQDLADFLATALPPGGADRMQRLAQSIVDVLPPGDKERGLYENFLVGARSLPAPTKKDDAAVKQQKLF